MARNGGNEKAAETGCVSAPSRSIRAAWREVGLGWRFAVIVALVLMVGLRVVALDSDAYPRLTWSSALLTDEGFYIHNARNQVLFGHERTDEWNNALIMPTLHYVQVACFHLFGVGAVQARLISVILGLLTLLVFFAALRRAFGLNVALIGTLFLGLDHVNLLYSRLALMDAPAALPLVCAFYAFVRGCRVSGVGCRVSGIGWLVMCGALLGLGYATRGLCAFVLPVPFLALGVGCWVWGVGGEKRSHVEEGSPLHPFTLSPLQSVGAVLGGLLLALGAFFALWYGPHRAELTRLNAYYLTYQLKPDSLRHLYLNIVHAFFGDERGMSPYLMRHTPVQFMLVIVWLIAKGVGCRVSGVGEQKTEGEKGRKEEGEGTGESPIIQLPNYPITQLPYTLHPTPYTLYLIFWLAIAWGVLAVISYSPSRYYVLFYPALAALAALALVNIQEVWAALRERRRALALLGGFLTYHLAQPTARRWWPAQADVVCAGIALAVLMALWWGGQWKPNPPRFKRLVPTVLMSLWAVVNLYWTGDWLTHLTYAQRDADRWLATHLPADSVLIGDVAPGLCLNNRFRAVNVILKLCNNDRPVERFAPAPRYIAILDGKWKEVWWQAHYPQLVVPQRRLQLLHIVRWEVGIYKVVSSQ